MIGSALAAGLGLIIGSFLGALTWRLPRGGSVARGRSACPACGAALRGRDLVPVLSWLLARGRCRHCGTGISPRYPLIELTTGGLFALVVLRQGDPLVAGLLLALVAVLVALAVIDLEHGILPNTLNAAALVLALALEAVRGGLPGLEGAILGAVVAVAGAWGLRLGFRLVMRREGLGLGDVKFAACAGALLRPTDWAPFLFLAGLAGGVMGLVWRRLGWGAEFPFGPALIAALLILVLFPEVGAPFLAR